MDGSPPADCLRVGIRENPSRVDSPARKSAASRATGNEALGPEKRSRPMARSTPVKHVDVGYIVEEMVAGVTGKN